MATTIAGSRSAQGRELLLQVARRLFMERGYNAVSMQQIAEEAHMTKGAPYYHFAGKQELFVQVSMQIFTEIFETLERAMMVGETFQDRLTNATLTAVHAISGDFSLWYSDVFREIDQAMFKACLEAEFGSDQMPDVMGPAFQRAVEDGEITRVSADAAARVYFLLLKELLDSMSPLSHRRPGQDPDLRPDDLVREAIDILFHGIA